MRDESAGVAPQTLDDEGEALRFLLKAGELFASSLDFREILASITQLAIPALADFVLIDLLQPDGTVHREHGVHVDPEKEGSLSELASLTRVESSEHPGPSAHVMTTGEPMFVREIRDDTVRARFPPEQRQLVRSLGIRSLISAPLTAPDRVLGAITLGLSERDSLYDQTHFDLVVELARRAGFAMDHALLYAAAEKAREEAERSRAALHELVRSSNHVIIEFDVHGRYLSVASTAAPLVYRPREELLGRTVHEVLPPETAELFAGWIETAIREGRSIDIEYQLPIGSRRPWFAGSVSPIGKDRAVWVVHDVTKRRVAEEALAESERRFRSTFDQAAVGISHIDLGGRFLRVNRRLASIVGYTREELLRLTFQDITHPEDRAAHEVQADRLLAGQIDSYTIEKRYVRKSGELVWVSVTGSLVRGEDGRPDYFISVIQDVTDRRNLEEQLIRAQKMEAVGRMAGGVAHEFNNALTTITGFADLVLRTLPQQDPLRPDIEEISHAAWRAAGVANRLMVFSSTDVSRPEVLDLGGVVAGAQRMLGQLLGEDIVLELELYPEPTYVRADRRQLEQAIVNLAVNSRDAMPRGGKLAIATAVVRLDQEETARLGELVPGEYVRLTVQDTGEGMAPDVLGRIFDPFFTTKTAGKGTGLGLSIVYGIVTRAGGGVGVESEPGSGTTFFIYLPRAEVAKRGVVVAGDAPSNATRSDRILLVEDDPGVRMLAERVMKGYGYKVVVASSPAEALRAITDELGRFDLLMTDLVMPGMNGRELAQTLTSVQPGLRVLFTSGYTSDQALRRQVESEGGELLKKPFAPQELDRAVRRALQR